VRIHRRRLGLIGLLIAVWLATSAILAGLKGGGPVQPATPIAKRLAATATIVPLVATATPIPSPTLLIPTRPLTPGASSSAVSGPFSIPSEPGHAFTLEMTEAEVNEYAEAGIPSIEGVTIQDIQISLQANKVICKAQVTHEESGLKAGVTVSGAPKVVDGSAYFAVSSVELDKSLSGLMRLIAKAMIDQAIEEYSTPNGILVPVENVEFQEIQVSPGVMRVIGRTR